MIRRITTSTFNIDLYTGVRDLPTDLTEGRGKRPKVDTDTRTVEPNELNSLISSDFYVMT